VVVELSEYPSCAYEGGGKQYGKKKRPKERDEGKSMQPAREKSVKLATMDSTTSECLGESEEREKAAKAVTPCLDIADQKSQG
jgi:hypothetical protein